jgi:rubredoxin
MEINFKCKKCKKEFDCEMGKIGINTSTMRPEFEKDIICPRCGKLRIKDVLLTEIGQSQMTEATFDL